MPIKFTSDLSQDQLVEEMLWYIENGMCPISQQLIYKSPVTVKTKPAQRPTQHHNHGAHGSLALQHIGSLASPNEIIPPQLMLYSAGNMFGNVSEDDDVHADTAQSLAPRQLSNYLLQDLTRTGVLHSDIAVTASPAQAAIHIYEEANLARWMQGNKTDPMTRDIITRVNKLSSPLPGLGFSKDAISHLTKQERIGFFIQNFLSALQTYIANDERQEVKVWLDAWQIALRQNNPTITDVELSSATNIMLPNSKTLTVHARTSQPEILVLLAEYRLNYKPTQYQQFIAYLNYVKEHQDEANSFDRFMSQADLNDGRNIMHSELVDELDLAIDPDAAKHQGMFALQIACHEDVVPAVAYLATKGAKLRTADLGRLPNDKRHNANEQEILYAYSVKNLEMMRALRPCYIQHDSILLPIVAYKAAAENQLDFLKVLIEEFHAQVNPNAIMQCGLEDLSVEIVRYVAESYRQNFLFCVPENDDAFHLHPCTNSDALQRLAAIFEILLPLNHKFLKILNPVEATLFPKELQSNITRSNRAHELASEISKQRNTNCLNGMEPDPLQVVVVLLDHLYRTFYKHPEWLDLFIHDLSLRAKVIEQLSARPFSAGFSEKVLEENVMAIISPSTFQRARAACVIS